MKKLLFGVLMLGWIPTLAIVAGAKWTDVLLAQGRTPIKVTRIYTGPDGKTKVEESRFRSSLAIAGVKRPPRSPSRACSSDTRHPPTISTGIPRRAGRWS